MNHRLYKFWGWALLLAATLACASCCAAPIRQTVLTTNAQTVLTNLVISMAAPLTNSFATTGHVASAISGMITNDDTRQLTFTGPLNLGTEGNWGTDGTLITAAFAGAFYGDGNGITNLNTRIYDVREFGAIPDDELVDNLALQLALDYASTNGGGTVYMPRGTYLIGTNYAYPTVTTENSINLICLSSNNITLEGAGMGVTILKGHPVAGATARNLFGAGGGAAPETERVGVTNFTFRNFTIDGNYPLCTNIGDATQLYYCDRLTLENIEFKDINGDAMDAAPLGYANATAVVKGCRFQNVKSAIHPGPIAFLSVSDCTFRECGGTNLVGDIDAVWEITSTLASKWERLYYYASKTNGGLVAHINGNGAHDFTDVNIHMATTVHSVTNIHIIGANGRVNFSRLRFASDTTYNDSVALYGAANSFVNVRDSHFVGKRAIRFDGATSMITGNRFENAGTLSVAVSGGRTVVTDNHFSGSSVGLDIASPTATPNSIVARNYFYNQLLYGTGGGTNQIIANNIILGSGTGINVASSRSYIVNNSCPEGFIRFSSVTNIITGNTAQYLTFSTANAKYNYISDNFLETCTFIGGATAAITNDNTMINNRSYTNTWNLAPYGGLTSGVFVGDGSGLTNQNWRWVDMIVSGTSVASNPSGDPPALLQVPGQNYFGYAYYFDDRSYWAVQSQHKFASTNASNPELYFEPHIHVSCTNTAAGTNATFGLDMYYGAVYAQLTNRVAVTNSITLTNAYGHYILSFGSITNNALIGRSSAIFRGRIIRVDGGDGDVGASSPVWVDSLDIHIPVQQWGSDARNGDP